MTIERTATGDVGATGATGSGGPANTGYVSGGTAFYGPRGGRAAGTAVNAQPANGVVHFLPFQVDNNVALTVDRIGFHLVTAGSAGSLARLGIFYDYSTSPGGNPGRPGDVLLDAGTVSSAAGTDITITISQLLTPYVPGGITPTPKMMWYWLAYAQQGAPVTTAVVRAQRAVLCCPPMPYDATIQTRPPTGYTASGVTGAFANTPTVSLATAELAFMILRAQ